MPLQQVIPLDAEAAAAQAAGASASDLDLIARLKQRAQDFEIARQELVRMGAAVARTNDYELLMEYSRLVDRAESIKSKIATATTAIDNAVKWARSALGDLRGYNLGALGAIWVLPAAIIMGAIAVIGYWLTDYRKFSLRFNEQSRIAAELIAAGADPAQAQIDAGRAVSAAAPGMFAGALGGSALVGIIVIVGLVIFANAQKGKA